jgi:hypothetical protein
MRSKTAKTRMETAISYTFLLCFRALHVMQNQALMAAIQIPKNQFESPKQNQNTIKPISTSGLANKFFQIEKITTFSVCPEISNCNQIFQVIFKIHCARNPTQLFKKINFQK